jgi:hypothetical protein
MVSTRLDSVRMAGKQEVADSIHGHLFQLEHHRACLYRMDRAVHRDMADALHDRFAGFHLGVLRVDHRGAERRFAGFVRGG